MSHGMAARPNSVRSALVREETAYSPGCSGPSGSTRPVSASARSGAAKARASTATQSGAGMQSSSVTATTGQPARRIAIFCDAPSPDPAWRM